MIEKICKKCSKSLPIADFCKTTANKDGFNNRCRSCSSVEKRERNKNYRNRQTIDIPESQICHLCGLLLSREAFCYSKSLKNGLALICKSCRKEARLRCRKALSNRSTIDIPEFKKCSRCQKPKGNGHFSRNRSKTDGLNTCCKVCASSFKKEKWIKNSYRRNIKPPAIKFCPGCKNTLNNSLFPKLRGASSGLHVYCKSCCTSRFKLRNYGLPKDEYEKMVRQQGGVCALCKGLSGARRVLLGIDHDHLTGKIRGLLCGKCNCFLGFVKDSVKICNALLLYLKNESIAEVDILGRQRQDCPPKVKCFAQSIKLTYLQKKFILNTQGSICKICGTLFECNSKINLDHSHVNGLIRGYLCTTCNLAVAFCNENIDLIEKAKVYLSKSKGDLE